MIARELNPHRRRQRDVGFVLGRRAEHHFRRRPGRHADRLFLGRVVSVGGFASVRLPASASSHSRPRACWIVPWTLQPAAVSIRESSASSKSLPFASFDLRAHVRRPRSPRRPSAARSRSGSCAGASGRSPSRLRPENWPVIVDLLIEVARRVEHDGADRRRGPASRPAPTAVAMMAVTSPGRGHGAVRIDLEGRAQVVAAQRGCRPASCGRCPRTRRGLRRGRPARCP